MKYVIVNADDFGLSQGTNEAIEKAHQEGILTSTSIFATTPAVSEAVAITKRNPGLGTGIHLSLTWGKSVLPSNKIPLLVDRKRYFYPSYLRLIILSMFNKNFLKQVENEFDAQIRFLSKKGIKIDHINSQQHVHMIPNIFSVTKKLAKKHNVRFIRFSNEDFFLVPSFPEASIPFLSTNLVKFLLLKTFSLFIKRIGDVKVDFIGLLYTTKTNPRVLCHILNHIDQKISEILLHPAIYHLSSNDCKYFDYTKQRCLDFMQNPTREVELLSLTNPCFKKSVSMTEITFTNYRELAKII